MYTLYGIPNCDTVKKAMNWLKKHTIPFQFHDYKLSGISSKDLRSWCGQTGWEIIFNKRSTTYKELPPQVQNSITNAENAIPIMQQYPSIIKRPIIVKNKKVVAVGFDEKKYEEMLGAGG